MKIKLFIHKLKCRYWNWRLPKDLNMYLSMWQKIDHRRDKSWSGRDFRFWLYLRKVDNDKKVLYGVDPAIPGKDYTKLPDEADVVLDSRVRKWFKKGML